MQYKIAESPIPSAEEESSSEDEEDGPRKPKIDPDDPVARESNLKIFIEVALDITLIDGWSFLEEWELNVYVDMLLPREQLYLDKIYRS